MVTDYGSYTWPTESGSGSSGVTSLNTLTGDVILAAGTGITITPSGQTLTIAATAVTSGNLTDAGTDGITITGGTGAVLGSGTTISQHVADATHNGYLSSTDWNTFNTAAGGGVASISIVSANGFAGSSSGGTTPALTLTTTITGILQGNGTAISAATTTGSGSVVLATGPTLSNPIVGTQSQGDASTKAASTSYVDTAVSNAVAGINPAVAVQAATTGAGDTSGFTYNNGASGVGATLTGSVNTAVTIDGYTFTAVGQRLLVKNDTQSPSGAFNGIYSLTVLQTGILAPVFTRATDYNQPSDINNTGAIPVVNGTTNGTTSWVQTAQVVTVGTTPLVFVEFSKNPANYLLVANNLSDVNSKTTSFNNLSPMTTSGDLIYGGASGAGTRLATGTAGSVLRAGTPPAWSTATYPSTATGTGKILRADGTNWVASTATYPDTAGTSGNVLTSDGTNWVSSTPASSNNAYLLQNLGLSVSVATNAMTIALKQSDGSTDPASGSGSVQIGFRSSTATSGQTNIRSATAATSIIIPSGASLGQTSAINQYVWVYAMDNAGTVELAVSGVKLFPDKSIQSSTTIGAGSTSGTTLYSTTGRSNLPIRIIGRLLVNESTAGTWASNTTDVVVAPTIIATQTDWANDLTWTWTGLGASPTNNNVWYKRVGDTMFVRGNVTSATSTAVPLKVALPSGIVFDSTKSSSVASVETLGVGYRTATSTNGVYINGIGYSAFYDGSDTANIYFGTSTTSNATDKNNASANIASGNILAFNFALPVAGWSTFGP